MTINDAVKYAVRLANMKSSQVFFNFNGIRMVANPGDSEYALICQFHGSGIRSHFKSQIGIVEARFNESGGKYLREMQGLVDGKADVYAVLLTFNVTCPARQHAIKKLLCSGIRGKGDCLQDLKEARDAIDRAIQIAESSLS